MEFYSQKDKRWADEFLGNSKATMAVQGCFVAAFSTIFQISPLEILKHKEWFTANGNFNSAAAAKFYGGEALAAVSKAPPGWSIAVTNHYAPDFPTHFFPHYKDPVEDLVQEIDPLDKVPLPEPLIYNVVQFRPFLGIKLTTADWKKETEKWAKDTKIISSGWETPDAPMSQLRVAAAIRKAINTLPTHGNPA